MRQRLLIVICLLTPLLARADPVVVNPSSVAAFWVVSFAALVVETGVVALLLFFSGLAPLPVFFGYLVANVGVFLFVFLPLLSWGRLPVWVIELGVAAIDGVSIKLLASFDIFQADTYTDLKWLRAFIISGIGNLASFFIGHLASHTWWQIN